MQRILRSSSLIRTFKPVLELDKLRPSGKQGMQHASGRWKKRHQLFFFPLSSDHKSSSFLRDFAGAGQYPFGSVFKTERIKIHICNCLKQPSFYRQACNMGFFGGKQFFKKHWNSWQAQEGKESHHPGEGKTDQKNKAAGCLHSNHYLLQREDGKPRGWAAAPQRNRYHFSMSGQITECCSGCKEVSKLVQCLSFPLEFPPSYIPWQWWWRGAKTPSPVGWSLLAEGEEEGLFRCWSLDQEPGT